MSKKTFKVFKLHFTTPLHIGDARDDYSISQKTIASDTMYAAITATLAKLGREIKEGDLGFTISSLFPFYQKDKNSNAILFFPKPLKQTLPNISDSTIRKKVKKVSWIDQTYFERILKGETLFDNENDYENIKGEFLLSNNENFNEKFISSQVNIHACISREAKDAKPYYMDRLYFSDYSGLYFLAEGDTKLIKDALDLLQHEGIGTDKNVGNGAFECSEEEIEEITLEFPEKSDYVLSLSTFIPESKEQLDNLIGDDNVAYDFQRRGGWITTQPISKLRKNTIYAFTAASVFYAKDTTKSFTSGEFKDLTPKALIGTIKHSIYRCGKSIFIPLKL